MSLATQAAEYASAMASAYAMDWHSWSVEAAIIWSDEALDLAFNVRGTLVQRNLNRPGINHSAEAWAETAARLMNGDY